MGCRALRYRRRKAAVTGCSPKCQGNAARAWLEAREADLLPVGYFHVVVTVPAEVADIAFHNKAFVYDLLIKAASEAMMTIAADPRHLGARIGITAVLHTWGSALTYHPHIHMIVPGGGLSGDGTRWVSSRPAFLLPVRVLSKLFRGLFLTRLIGLHEGKHLQFFGEQAGLIERRAFLRHLAPVRKKSGVVYAKPPFAGPEVVLAYLSRYMHRVADSNRRLISLDESGVTFHYKDYRRASTDRRRTMTLAADEFIRRFLLHVLPRASTGSATTASAEAEQPPVVRPSCPCCGGRMIIIEILRGTAHHGPAGPARLFRNDGVVTRHDLTRPHVRSRRFGNRGRLRSTRVRDPQQSLDQLHVLIFAFGIVLIVARRRHTIGDSHSPRTPQIPKSP